MDNIIKFSKVFLSFFVFLVFFLLLLIEVLENGGVTTKMNYVDDQVMKNSKVVMKTHKRSSGAHHVHQKIDFNLVSKRRVPNGPDPIHNRFVFTLFLYGAFFLSIIVKNISGLSRVLHTNYILIVHLSYQNYRYLCSYKTHFNY